MGSYPYPRNGILKIDYEFILIFRKNGKPQKIEKGRKQKSKLTKDEWNEYFTGHWNFPGEKQDKHLAMFPIELPNRLIKMFTFIGDTVLDPFLGSGTTSLSAKNLSRNSIGYEINKEFLPIIRRKVGIDSPDLFGNHVFLIEKQETLCLDFLSEIQKLPYIFTDPVKMDKKVDPKKLRFGSKIDKDGANDIEYYQVKNIISPDLVELNSGLILKLIGVRIKQEKKSEAVDFLRKMTKVQRVFLRFDSVKYDQDQNLLCYLYLKNKTFINAHLIKSGFVSVDKEMDYKHKTKFLKYQGIHNC